MKINIHIRAIGQAGREINYCGIEDGMPNLNLNEWIKIWLLPERVCCKICHIKAIEEKLIKE